MSWGAGTRRLAALEIAAVNQGQFPITLVDEVERGLEPYRQRMLMMRLRDKCSQVFLTTHSAAALSAAEGAAIWHMGNKNNIGRLPESVSPHIRNDPEAFLARLTIVAEGLTEVGFVGYLLEKAIEGDICEQGIWITNGDGNASSLKLLKGVAGSGIQFGGFVDNEGSSTNEWKELESQLGELLFRWEQGCLEENVIRLVPSERLEEFIKDTDGTSGIRLRTLAERLGVTDKDFGKLKASCADLGTVIIDAAIGRIPASLANPTRGEKKAFKKHAESWFKSIEGGRELAEKVFVFGLWPKLKKQLLPFVNAVRTHVKLGTISDLTS